MTRIQEILLKLETDYYGHPYYVTGHALYTAIARRADADTRRQLHCSHGMCLPGEYGTYPDRHPHSGGLGKLATGLRDVDSYSDLLVYRDPEARWLREDSPRAAHNTLPVRTHGGRLTVAPSRYIGRPPHSRNHKRAVGWHVHAVLHAGGGRERGQDHADADGPLPVPEDVLDSLRLGGGRNYGLGETSLVDAQVIDLSELDYTWLREADQYALELLTPYVLWSEYPGADAQSVPGWWTVPAGHQPRTLRRRRARIVEDGQAYDLGTVDHGQTVGYAGDRPIETARNGIRRIGTHARYGFGEFRVVPAEAARGLNEAVKTEAPTGGA